MYEHGMIAPVVALVIWSLIMLVWLYATRIPAMAKAKVDPEKVKDGGAPFDLLPVGARRVAANYNHLHEQPTLFYAICFALQLLGQTQDINIGLAWLYVVLRVLHSLVQATINIIMIRWLIFMASALVLMALTFHAAIALGWANLDFMH
jgi:hypothetical protein